MSGRLRFAFALVALCAAVGGVIGALGAALWADLQPAEREVARALLAHRAGLVVLVLLLCCALLGLALRALYWAYVLAPLKLREQTLILLDANQAHRLEPIGGPELRALAQAVNRLAEQRDLLQRDVAERIREARTSIEEERNRLAALMSELAQSVVVCNLDGRILLYNDRARLQFRALSESAGASPGGTLIGLGRSIFSVLERNLITHALDSIQSRLGKGGSPPVANFVTTTRTGQLLRVQMTPVLGATAQDADGTATQGERPISGYVLILDDITRTVETRSRRDQLLQSLTEGTRAALGNVRAAVESLIDYPDMEPAQRERFLGVIEEEVRKLGARLDETETRYADALKTRWPLEEMLGVDLIAAAQRRIEASVGSLTRTEELDATLWLKVDSFSLIQGLVHLAGRLKSEFGIREVCFRLARAGRLAHLDMAWSGTPIAVECLRTWEREPMDWGGEASLLTLRDVIERHDGELWYQLDKAAQRAYFRLLIPVAAPQEPVLAPVPLRAGSRPEYYDFDLFRQTEESRALDERRLEQLTYTVFDTETTGLDPAGGDEIIQIGAVRIVNGRLLRHEVFDQLIDPRRPLDPESARIHGISAEMLRGQPGIEQVLPAFHQFCEDTVLVAHNAAFDMRFLQLKEQATGIAFRQPVLDTLLLSAVIHPHQESHRLEAIAERLGINVIGRHTALGDAIVTGEVFLRMLPLLAEQGIRTLREAREAAQRTYYARIGY
ncbi:MAG TPA: exonuclease domain-containing protein [Candidatus Competibacteraceae bacterium]|nr:exonuclease domain-containing protein [Candidatus Competibacteraceae bacterium]